MKKYNEKIFTGRKEEYDILQELLDKPGAELVAVLGRRRIGKTYLVKQAYATQLCFHFTGIKDATRNTMLVAFTDKIVAASRKKIHLFL